MAQSASSRGIEGGRRPDLAPPAATVGAVGWVRQNLLSSPLNIALTILALYVIYATIPPLLDWAVFSANWQEGHSRDECVKPGACWTMIRARFGQFIYGLYPRPERWRVDLFFALFFGTAIPLLVERVPAKRYLAIFVFAILPLLAVGLLYGGLGLPAVETRLWGGLMLTLVLGIVGLVVSLPVGVLLALGRRSNLPVLRLVCTTFIEVVRAVPLITVLFMAAVMLPLFLPTGVSFDKLVRGMVGIALFNAAYMAEVVRGGLQAMPKGQYEGAMALGLGYWKMTGLIVLPQALRISIPGIVNSFIAGFKDTTLVIVIGMFELLGVAQQSSRDPNWMGTSHEGFAFAGIVFFVFCFSMSRYSQHLERKLRRGQKR